MTRVRRRYGTEMLPGFSEELWLRDLRPSGSPLRDTDDPVDELALSIEEKGVLQAIVVRPVKDGFEVVAGNRRLRACRLLRMKKVPCYVVGLDAKQAYEVSLVENLQRNTLNPIEEARAFRRYVDDYGYGAVSELAKRIGKSEPYVSKRLGLLELPKEVQSEIIRRRIAPSLAEELSSLDSGEASRIAGQITAHGITRTEVRKAVRSLKEEESTPAYSCAREEAAIRKIDRAMSRCMASLKVCLTQLDDIIDSIGEDEWLVRREALINFRRSIHEFIDRDIVLQKRGNFYSSFLTTNFSGVKQTKAETKETRRRSKGARAAVDDSPAVPLHAS